MTTAFRQLRRVAVGVAFAVAAIIVVFVSDDVISQTSNNEPRAVPARTVPVPNTVSPEMQALVAAAPAGNWNSAPTTTDEWKKLSAPSPGRNLPALREKLGVKTEAMTVNG